MDAHTETNCATARFERSLATPICLLPPGQIRRLPGIHARLVGANLPTPLWANTAFAALLLAVSVRSVGRESRRGIPRRPPRRPRAAHRCCALLVAGGRGYGTGDHHEQRGVLSHKIARHGFVRLNESLARWRVRRARALPARRVCHQDLEDGAPIRAPEVVERLSSRWVCRFPEVRQDRWAQHPCTASRLRARNTGRPQAQVNVDGCGLEADADLRVSVDSGAAWTTPERAVGWVRLSVSPGARC